MDLSIIIINFNTKEMTINCIRSILKGTKNIDYEIILVDNASNDGSYSEFKNIKKKYKSLKIIQNQENLGFAKANNQGIKISKGKYLLLLNSDTLIKNNVLGEMVKWMDVNPKIGVASCALRNKDGTLQGSGGFFPTLPRIFNWMFFIEDIPFIDSVLKPFHPVHAQSPFYKGIKQFEDIRNQDWITGAFFLTRKKIIDNIGFFDEDYFMYTEEVDLCFRIKKFGWQVLYIPKWSITHLGGASSTKEFPILSEYKGIKIFYKKNLPKWQYPVVRTFLKAGAILRIIIFGVLKGSESIKTYAKAFIVA